MSNRVFQYQYIAPDEVERKNMHLEVPEALDPTSYLRGFDAAMAEVDAEAFDFKPIGGFEPSDSRVYQYQLIPPGETEAMTVRVAVPVGFDPSSYLRGRADEMAEIDAQAFDFKHCPEYLAFDIHRTLASGAKDVWREYYTSLEAAEQSWAGRVGAYVSSVDIQPVTGEAAQ